MKKRAFTIVELMAVVIILGVLIAVAIPQYRQARRKADWAQAFLILDAIYDAGLYFADAYDNPWALFPAGGFPVDENSDLSEAGITLPDSAFDTFCYYTDLTTWPTWVVACRENEDGTCPCGYNGSAGSTEWGIRKSLADGTTEVNIGSDAYP